MTRLDVFLCFVPPGSGSRGNSLPEEHFRHTLGDLVGSVDDVLSRATPRRILSAIAKCVHSAPAFSHQMNLIVGKEDSREIILGLLYDLTHHQDGDDAVPLQCMFFAFDGGSVVCEIVGEEEMGSVMEVMSAMRHIVLVALKFRCRTMTLVVVEQLSTTLIASMLGCAWCNVWLLLGGGIDVERSVAVVREALSVRDAVRNFCHFPEEKISEINDVEVMLRARAFLDGEAQQIAAPWQQYAERGETKAGTERLAVENATLRNERAELQTLLREREEYFTEQIELKEDELTQLRRALQHAEENEEKLTEAEVRITELESCLAEKEEELYMWKEHRDKNPLEASERTQQIEIDFHTRQEELCDRTESPKNGDIINALQRELSETQAKLREMQQQWEASREENLQNVMEFQEREREWQMELRQREKERETVAEECRRLRSVVASQGSGMDVVKEAVEATRLLQEQELDELLKKIRAISSASAPASHRRISPRSGRHSDPQNCPRMLSPPSL
ncbi:hypothetical protein MOQ_002038 [Trypanosoma cruzi marinkellei]|uniref:Uncharacterized protein n=1 Tax=Trypanosoma cruzi marinkellei TaxID=85056 RepID=K2MR35_TRYCR|nr:hypothetical protein MOQ_002038 [Trypanosoma cruzi marinkellei]